MGISRRSLIGLAMLVPLFRADARAQTSASCYDPESLPSAQRSIRKTLGFKDLSPEPGKRCELCAFFTATRSGCGTCALLSGGPVTKKSVCNSWARRS